MSGKAVAGTAFRTDPSRKLTEKQAAFLDALFENGGRVGEAMKTAGYNSSRSSLMKSLREEIAARTKDYLAVNGVKAATRIVEGLDADGTTPLNQMDMRMKAAESILDRIGVSKKQTTEVTGQVVHGVVLLPAKKEVDKIFDLDEGTYNGLMSFSRKVAIALEKTIDCKRVGVSVIGLEVPHVHVHLIPLNSMDDARFIEKASLTKEEFEATAKAIHDNL